MKTRARIITAIYKKAADMLNSDKPISEVDMALIMNFYTILIDRLTEEDWASLEFIIGE